VGTASGFLFAEFAEGQPVEFLRLGTFTDAHGREIEITSEVLDAMVANFAANQAGQDVPIDVDHERSEAAGWVTKLWREGDRLLAEVDWNELGERMVGEKIYKYLSAAIDTARWVLTSISLVNFPAVKGLRPVELAEGLYAWGRGRISVAAFFRARIHQSFASVADQMAMSGVISAEQRAALGGAIDEATDSFAAQVGELGELLIEAPGFESYYYSEVTGRETVEMNEEERREELRQEILAELEDKRKARTELREEVRTEVEAELREEMERRGKLAEFAAEICGGEAGLSTDPAELVTLMAGMEAGALARWQEVLRAKVADFSETGSSREGRDDSKELPAELGEQLQVWIDAGHGVAEFFSLNADAIDGAMDEYNLTEFDKGGES